MATDLNDNGGILFPFAVQFLLGVSILYLDAVENGCCSGQIIGRNMLKYSGSTHQIDLPSVPLLYGAFNFIRLSNVTF